MQDFLAKKAPTIPQYQMGLSGNVSAEYKGIPHCWLIGADGNLLYDGHPGSLSSKDIAAALKSVKKAEGDEAEARASKMVSFAETLAADQKYLKAQGVLTKASKEFKDTEAGKKAAETLKEWKKDEKISAELNAQLVLSKMFKLDGGLERPLEKMKAKDLKVAKVKLESFIKKYKEEAPGAAAIAESWANAFSE